MSFITLDFETAYRSKKHKGTPGENYSLRDMTYEEYIRDPRFKVHGVGVKIDRQPTIWVNQNIKHYLQTLFYAENHHTLLCHNTLFDGAILSWYYHLAAEKYLCTQAISRALWAQYPSSLDALTRRLFPNDPTKWKGKELADVDGLWDLTPELDQTLGGYCIQDVDITFEAFAAIYPYFPEEELDVLDLTLQMFIHPTFKLDKDRVIRYQRGLLDQLDNACKKSGVARTVLSSNPQFAKYLQEEYSIVVPEIPSPTQKNSNNTKLALAKDDLEFIEIRKRHPELDHVWDARIAIKSTNERTRGPRLLNHAQVSDINPEGKIAIPLSYCGAHTKRWSGTNKLNPQNFKRGSELRYALCAPPGYKVVVRDLSNIEGRMNAWFNEQEDKLQAFREGRDIYNELATIIYNRPIDRKRTEIDAITGKEIQPDFVEGFVGKTAELGLGYGMGAPKFRHTLAQKEVLIPLDMSKRVVSTWRAKNHMIARGWKRCDRVIFDMATPNLRPYSWKCIQIETGRIRLPNGLYLTYPELRLVNHPESRQFEYWNGQFRKSLYGGLLMENIIQALSRIVMSQMMLEIQRRVQPLGGRIVLTVHDEIVVIVPSRFADPAYHLMGEVMSTPPAWCNDGTLTLASEGGIADNYSK